MRTPPTHISPAGAFAGTAIHCKRDSSSLRHGPFVTVTYPYSSLTDMPESIYSTRNIKSNIRDCDREILLEKIRYGTKSKQTQVEMITGEIFFRSFGCRCSTWDPTATWTHAFFSSMACEGKSPDCDPGLPHVAAGTSVL